MDCKRARDLWPARVDGLLGPAELAAWEEHLAGCPGCSGVVRALGELETRLEALSDAQQEAPAYLKPRVMARLQEARPARFRAWWRFLNTRRLLAASTACLAFFAGLLVRELSRFNEWARTQGDGIQTVVLRYQAPDAQDVRLVGDFNAWGRSSDAVRAEQGDGGQWVFRVELAPGRYQYAFLVDGKSWLPDPGAPGIIPDGFGGNNSVLYVSDAAASRSL